MSLSFGKRVEHFQELKEAVASYCLNASEKIRSESLIAKSITVFVRTSPFQVNLDIIQTQRQSILQFQQIIVLR